jgi:hypothetical protein
MLKKALVTGLALIMVGALVIGTIQVLTPPADEHGGARGRVSRESTPTQEAQGLQNQGRNYETRDSAQGTQGQGQGQGQRGGKGRSGGQDGGQAAETMAWQTVEGTVIEVEELVVETADGQRVQVGLGPSHYREGLGFVLQVGDPVRVAGYYEGDEFKAGQVEVLDSGASIVLRDETGRPMWAGRGRRSG